MYRRHHNALCFIQFFVPAPYDLNKFDVRRHFGFSTTVISGKSCSTWPSSASSAAPWAAFPSSLVSPFSRDSTSPAPLVSSFLSDPSPPSSDSSSSSSESSKSDPAQSIAASISSFSASAMDSTNFNIVALPLDSGTPPPDEPDWGCGAPARAVTESECLTRPGALGFGFEINCIERSSAASPLVFSAIASLNVLGGVGSSSAGSFSVASSMLGGSLSTSTEGFGLSSAFKELTRHEVAGGVTCDSVSVSSTLPIFCGTLVAARVIKFGSIDERLFWLSRCCATSASTIAVPPSSFAASTNDSVSLSSFSSSARSTSALRATSRSHS
mmetsp:Transcript_18237/g.24672  ORF Transcript_18237/g.24672 Transcript_18237/m.24672 type:complete len:327 (+) Transcript_18237:117-1097(+)